MYKNQAAPTNVLGRLFSILEIYLFIARGKHKRCQWTVGDNQDSRCRPLAFHWAQLMSCVRCVPFLPSASKHAVSIGSPLWRNPAGHYIPGVTTSFDDVDVTEAFGKTANERQYTRMTARSLKRVRRNVTNRVFGSWHLIFVPFCRSQLPVTVGSSQFSGEFGKGGRVALNLKVTPYFGYSCLDPLYSRPRFSVPLHAQKQDTLHQRKLLKKIDVR